MSIVSDFVARLRAIVFRRAEERELEEELRLHVEMEEDYRRRGGVGHAEAHRQALIALGGVERVKEDVRDASGTRVLFDGAGDVRFALRTLRRNPGFAIVAVLTLAVGIGGATAVYSAVDAVLLAPLPYQQPGRLVRLYNTAVQAPNDRGFVTPVHFLEYRQGMSSFASIAAVLTYDAVGADIGRGDRAHRIRLAPVSTDYFDVVGVHPSVGGAFTRDDEHGGVNGTIQGARVIVISHRLWEDEFKGDAAAVGGTLVMDGIPYRIAGVMPPDFVDPLVPKPDAWTAANLDPGRDPTNADNHYLSVIARLRPGVSIPSAQAELTALATSVGEKYPDARTTRARLDPLKDDIVAESTTSLEIMLGAVALVLLIVCVNIATLMLVRGSERQREFAVRAALGGRRARIVRQMLVESIVIALAGDAAGLIVARAGMSAIVTLGQGNIPRLSSLTVDPRLLAFSIVLSTVCAVLFGAAPAFGAARTRPGEVLRSESRGASSGRGQTRLRSGLVAAQVALAFVLVVGAGLLLSSFAQLRQVDLGFRSANVFTFEAHLPASRYDSTARAAFYDDFEAAIEHLPGVRAAGGTSKLPATGSYNSWGTRPLTGPLVNARIEHSSFEQRVIAGDYFTALGIPLIAGRWFQAVDDSRAPLRVVVSKSVPARLFPGVDPVGQRLRTGGRDWEVIGVVGDVALDVEGHAEPTIYHAHRQFAGDRNWALTQVVSTTGNVDGVAAQVRRSLNAIDPQLVLYRSAPLDDVLGRGNATRVFTLRLLLAFAGVAVGLAVLGLYGTLAYSVRLRSREFGIRMALGAGPSAIRAMVLRHGLIVTGIGLISGVVGAALLSRVMTSLLFHVKPMDPAVIVTAVVIMASIGLMAAYVPARQATSVDPRETLS
ncbi:MAG TPA: ABC transporter permease [Gemmatimonadaceae bacterium]|nr:ABC transporter permease [Gemmatimonadaceae bacterium]